MKRLACLQRIPVLGRRPRQRSAGTGSTGSHESREVVYSAWRVHVRREQASLSLAVKTERAEQGVLLGDSSTIAARDRGLRQPRSCPSSPPPPRPPAVPSCGTTDVGCALVAAAATGEGAAATSPPGASPDRRRRARPPRGGPPPPPPAPPPLDRRLRRTALGRPHQTCEPASPRPRPRCRASQPAAAPSRGPSGRLPRRPPPRARPRRRARACRRRRRRRRRQLEARAASAGLPGTTRWTSAPPDLTGSSSLSTRSSAAGVSGQLQPQIRVRRLLTFSRSAATLKALRAGTANPMPSACAAVAVLMPTTRPFRSNNGPPEFSYRIAAPVWMNRTPIGPAR